MTGLGGGNASTHNPQPNASFLIAVLISEIFHSVQGEGELTGVPSVFVRTSGCNLRCAWCDTPYASWRPEGTEMPVDRVVDEVLKFPAAHVVLTGGEPMAAKEMPLLAAHLKQLGKHLTIETAGTLPPAGIACDLASISPKLANSTPPTGSIAAGWIARHERTRFQPGVIREWIERYPFQLKFVVERATDLAEIRATVAAIGATVPPWKVLLMPQGTDETTLRAREADLVAACKTDGYRFCQRLHIRLFGNTMGT